MDEERVFYHYEQKAVAVPDKDSPKHQKHHRAAGWVLKFVEVLPDTSARFHVWEREIEHG